MYDDIVYDVYNHELLNLVPTTYVTTPVAAFNFTANYHSPFDSQLPVSVLYKCMLAGTKSVVLRGCISFNPAYRENSRYSPYTLFKAAKHINNDRWLSADVKARYETYLYWLLSFVNEHTIIKYVELFNEYFFCRANSIQHNIAIMRHCLKLYRNVILPHARKDVLWGMSEPLLSHQSKDKFLHEYITFVRLTGLQYTGLQLHMRTDALFANNLQQITTPFAITENYTRQPITQPHYLYRCNG